MLLMFGGWKVRVVPELIVALLKRLRKAGGETLLGIGVPIELLVTAS
jgi:hypothetical protein